MRYAMSGRIVTSLAALAFVMAACGGGESSSRVPSPQAAGEQSAAAASSTEGELAPERESLSVRLDWSWYGGQIPIVMAVERGFFEAENLDVTVEQGQGSGTTVKVVGVGTEQIGHVNLSTAALSISAGIPVTVIATTWATGPIAIVSLESTGINSLDDLAGRSIGTTPTGSDAIAMPALFGATDLDEEDVEVVPMAGDAKLGALMSGQVDAINGDGFFWKLRVEEQGETANVMLYADLGINLLGYGFIVNNDYLAENSEVIERFTRAMLAAYEWSYANMDEAIGIFIRTTGTTAVAESLKVELEAARDHAGDPLGWNPPEKWTSMLDILEDYGGMQQRLEDEAYYTNEFVPEP